MKVCTYKFGVNKKLEKRKIFSKKKLMPGPPLFGSFWFSLSPGPQEMLIPKTKSWGRDRTRKEQAAGCDLVVWRLENLLSAVGVESYLPHCTCTSWYPLGLEARGQSHASLFGWVSMSA